MESAEQIQGIMTRGFEQRAVGCHDVNAHSSRSHCLLVIHVAATDPTTGAGTGSTFPGLNLPAGHPRGRRGPHHRCAGIINQGFAGSPAGWNLVLGADYAPDVILRCIR